MNQKVLSGLTATLFMTTLGFPLVSSANTVEAIDQVAEADPSQPPTQPVKPAPIRVDVAVKADQQPFHAAVDTGKTTAFNQISTPDRMLTHSVIKLGEQAQPKNANSAEREAIAKVQTHNLAGRKVAILYVRNIPVLTLTGSSQAASTAVKLGVQQAAASSERTLSERTIATAKSLTGTSAIAGAPEATSESSSTDAAAIAQADAIVSQSDPVLRAAAIAAKINQLHREGVDAKTITVSWHTQGKTSAPGEQYAIRANKTLIAVIDASTVLSDSTRSLETDALQATNRLRRLLGSAAPLSGISGKPNGWSQVAAGALQFSGLASWYGPGFNGSPSASGETFDQNALTAAHRTLPFGTKVLVTNLDNGQSVVVRINDRGPYSGGRIIDLSAAAARVLGLIQSGVAPVRLDVVNDDASAVITAGN